MSTQKKGLPKEPKLPKLTREQYNAVHMVIRAREDAVVQHTLDQQAPLIAASEKEQSRLRVENMKLQATLRERQADYTFEIGKLEQRIEALTYSLTLAQAAVKKAQTAIRKRGRVETVGAETAAGASFRAGVDDETLSAHWEGQANRDALAIAG